jgi:RNA polymerase sigma factor (sigma-70 family)
MYENPFKLLVDEPNRALETIMERHGPQLRARIELYISGDDALVEDVLLETLVAIWVDGQKAARMADPFVWMMAVAKKKALYRLRGEYRHLRVSMDSIYELPDSLRADSELSYRELRERVLKATERLTKREKELVIGAKLHDMDNRELGKVYGITVQRVKNLLSSGMKKIRHLFRNGKE